MHHHTKKNTGEGTGRAAPARSPTLTPAARGHQPLRKESQIIFASSNTHRGCTAQMRMRGGLRKPLAGRGIVFAACPSPFLLCRAFPQRFLWPLCRQIFSRTTKAASALYPFPRPPANTHTHTRASAHKKKYHTTATTPAHARAHFWTSHTLQLFLFLWTSPPQRMLRAPGGGST